MKKAFAKIEKMLFFYSCFLFKLENEAKLPGLTEYDTEENKRLREKNKKWYSDFIFAVNYALDKLHKQEKELIQAVYIKGIPKEELPYSTATFYNTKNRAFKKLQYLLLESDTDAIQKEIRRS